MRGVLRRLRRLVLAAMALGLLVLGGALLAAHTRWGRAQLRSRIEAALAGAYPGGARIASLDGSILGTLTLHGVELGIGAAGRGPGTVPAEAGVQVTVGTLRGAVALWPLLVQTVRIDALIVDDVHVIVRERPPAGPAREAASPWRLELPDVAIRGATLEIAPEIMPEVMAVRVAVGDVEAAGAVRWGAGRLRITGTVQGRRICADGVTIEGAVAAAIAPARDRPDAMQLSITAASGDARVWATARAEPARGAAQVVVSAVAIDLGRSTGGRLRGRGNLLAAFDVRPGDARGALVAYGDLDEPDVPVRRAGLAIAGGLDGATAVMLGAGDDALRASAIARAHVSGGTVVLDEARAFASAQGIGLPCTAPDAAGPGTARDRPGAAPRAPPPRCRTAAGEWTGHAALSGTIAPRLAVSGTGSAAGRGLVLDGEAAAGARAHAGAPRGGRPALQIGSLRSEFDVRVTGRGGSGIEIGVAGKATAAAVATSDLIVAAADGSYRLALGPELRLDRARVTATGMRRDDRALGSATVEVARRDPASSGGSIYDAGATVWPAIGGPAIDGPATGEPATGEPATGEPATGGITIAARARVRRTGATYRAELASVRVARGSSVWSGGGGTLIATHPAAAAQTELEVHGVTLRREGATIGLAGRYLATTGALDARVTGDGLDVAALDIGARGNARGALDLRRHAGRWSASATLAIADLAIAPGAAPIPVTANLVLTGQRLTLAAQAGPAHRGLAFALDVTAPRDPFDRAAWRRLDRDAIHTASITAQRVALADFLGRVGHPADDAPIGGVFDGTIGGMIDGTIGGAIRGTIDGTIDLAPAHPAGALAVRGLATSLGVLDGEVRVADRDGDVELAASAQRAGVAAAELTARFAMPRHPFDAAVWQDHGRALLRGLTARVDVPQLAGLGLDRRLADHGAVRWLAGRGVALPDHGRARAALALGRAAGDVQLTIELTDVAGGALRAPLSLHVAARAGLAGTRVHGELSGLGLSLGTVDGELAMTAERWLDAPAAALGAALTARWTLPAIPAASALALFGRGGVQAGTLDGSAMICGSLAAPVIPAAPATDRAQPVRPCGELPVVPTRLVARDLVFARRPGARPVPPVRELVAAATWDGDTARLTLDGRQAGGSLHVAATGRPDAIADATGQATVRGFDVASVARFLPGWLGSASGTVAGTLALGRGAQLSGDLVVTGGALSFPGALARLGALRNARARLSTRGDTILAEVDGELARGKLHLEAAAPVDLATLEIRTLHLDRISPLLAPRPIVTADLTARLYRTADRWKGNVRIERGSITLTGRAGTQLLDATLPADLKMAAQPPDIAERSEVSPAASAAPAASAPRLVLDVAPARLRLDAQIHLDAREFVTGIALTGTLRNPAPLIVSIGDTVGVRGKVEIASDDLEVLGRSYQLEDTRDGPSGLVFDNSLDPLLHVRMLHRFPQLVLFVDVRTRLSKLERPAFSSDVGSYTDNQLFSWFLGGAPGDATSARGAVAGLATRWVSGQLGNRLSRVLPIRLETSCDLDPAAPSTTIGSCTVGTRILDRLYLTYRARLQPRADENSADVDVQLRLGGGLLLEATAGDRGHAGADLLFGHRW